MILLCFMLLLHAQQTRGENMLNPAFTAFTKTVIEILNSGTAMWKRIGESQASQTVQEVVSKASDLEEANEKLSFDITGNKIQTIKDLRTRIRSLKDRLADLREPLTKFAYEIDSLSLNTSGDLRTAINRMGDRKLMELDEVEAVWTPQDPASHAKAVMALASATACLKKMQLAAKCLSNTIRNRTRDTDKVCTQESIEADSSGCYKSATPNAP